MKKFYFLFAALTLTVLGGDLESEVKRIDSRIENAAQDMQNAKTQLELNEAAGNSYLASLEKAELIWDQLYLRTTDKNQRAILRREFSAMMQGIRESFTDKRGDGGTIEGMLRCGEAQTVVAQMTELWMADEETAARWRRVAYASGNMGEDHCRIFNGAAVWNTVAYDEKRDLTFHIFPANCFTYKGIDYVVALANIPFGVCDDFICAVIVGIKVGQLAHLVK